ncbi:TetR/AcrR family transcriptional regulator [Streptomyces sp. NBC_00053]|uniref:TetR/AcrR family transcriptional regulator n=1 Tax=unclassified Streptomyces TaxID=2593676 RepID=UPI000F5B9515|nr:MULTISPECIES: TetR/AcrR family transcriptional regulator [unclassified Streptomyces]WSG53568.1 TetR/AcrR family transcriptional regulator [Streptomyces sp. NBC_01732]WSX04222.1 TetR/AcrR family transcriptional regulator [Streptomyces sp. NBC_00987]MCX5105659.1 TetR/AcrR family transcriptional regulator [Streptomyces sp. NBC_00439]MCX5503416.1 TetR/AcrR family transcriptional regulator [Streptomyces sp. NBC_00052]MCX5548049.1 TetR/AcrR family transcriptional regulator [Streptomyces sp. NBC_0
MGHREDLLEGAKRCLLEKGYARTTARDIVAASGTNLASIGYHYGSKEALLNLAFVKVTEEWGDLLTDDGQERAEGDDASGPPLDQFRDTWERVIDSFEETRSVWQLQMEVVSRIDKDPELRKALLDPQREGRDGLAEGMLGIDPEKDPEKARVAGLFCQALLAGVMVQWLMDSESAPSAQDLTDGLKVVLEGRGGSTS